MNNKKHCVVFALLLLSCTQAEVVLVANTQNCKKIHPGCYHCLVTYQQFCANLPNFVQTFYRCAQAATACQSVYPPVNFYSSEMTPPVVQF